MLVQRLFHGSCTLVLCAILKKINLELSKRRHIFSLQHFTQIFAVNIALDYFYTVYQMLTIDGIVSRKNCSFNLKENVECLACQLISVCFKYLIYLKISFFTTFNYFAMLSCGGIHCLHQ